MTIEKLTNHPAAQCHVEKYDNGAVLFVSYKTPVVLIDKNGFIHYRGYYSQTTAKQISWFLWEFTPYGYKEIKREFGKCINIYTGEIIPDTLRWKTEYYGCSELVEWLRD